MDTARQKKAMAIAERVQQDILSTASPPGTVIGSEMQLCAKYGVGRMAFREAMRILQFRGIAQMRRGPNGGLIVGAPRHDLLITRLATLLHAQRAAEQLREVRRVLASIATLLAHAAPAAIAEEHSALPLLAERARNVALTSIASTIETLCQSVLRQQDRAMTGGLESDVTRQLGSSRADSIARQIITRMRTSAMHEGARLGSEADLCARYEVGVPIARQVVRLLEESGVVECQRGRGRGLFVRTPGTETVMHALASSLVSCGASMRESWRLGQLLNIEIVVLAAGNGILPGNRQALLRLLTSTAARPPADASDILAIDKTVDECAQNPILFTILQSLKTYSRLRNPDRDVTLTRYASECGPEFLTSTREVASAILSGDGPAARRAQRLKNELFIRRVTQFVPSASQLAQQ